MEDGEPGAAKNTGGGVLRYAINENGYNPSMTPPRSHGRYPYSADHRPPPSTTGRTANGWRSMSALNLEWFSFGEGLGAELAPGGPPPDVLNYAWRDYGNRVGVFRLAELFAELKLPVSLLVNAQMIEHAPQAVAAFPGAEIVGHGRSNSERQGTLSEADERALDRGDHRRDREAFRCSARAAGSGPGSRSRR